MENVVKPVLGSVPDPVYAKAHGISTHAASRLRKLNQVPAYGRLKYSEEQQAVMLDSQHSAAEAAKICGVNISVVYYQRQARMREQLSKLSSKLKQNQRDILEKLVLRLYAQNFEETVPIIVRIKTCGAQYNPSILGPIGTLHEAMLIGGIESFYIGDRYCILSGCAHLKGGDWEFVGYVS